MGSLRTCYWHHTEFSYCDKAYSIANKTFINKNAFDVDVTKRCYSVNRWYTVKVCFHHKKYVPKSFFLGIYNPFSFLSDTNVAEVIISTVVIH